MSDNLVHLYQRLSPDLRKMQAWCTKCDCACTVVNLEINLHQQTETVVVMHHGEVEKITVTDYMLVAYRELDRAWFEFKRGNQLLLCFRPKTEILERLDLPPPPLLIEHKE